MFTRDARLQDEAAVRLVKFAGNQKNLLNITKILLNISKRYTDFESLRTKFQNFLPVGVKKEDSDTSMLPASASAILEN